MTEVSEYTDAFNQLCPDWEVRRDTNPDYPDIVRTWWIEPDGQDWLLIAHSKQSGIVLVVSSRIDGETEHHTLNVIERVKGRLDEKRQREVTPESGVTA